MLWASSREAVVGEPQKRPLGIGRIRACLQDRKALQGRKRLDEARRYEVHGAGGRRKLQLGAAATIGEQAKHLLFVCLEECLELVVNFSVTERRDIGQVRTEFSNTSLCQPD